MVGITVHSIYFSSLAFWLHAINYLQIPWVTIGLHLMHLFSNQRVKRSKLTKKKSAYILELVTFVYLVNGSNRAISISAKSIFIPKWTFFPKISLNKNNQINNKSCKEK